MKTNRFFALAAFVALALVACKKSEPTPTPDPEPEFTASLKVDKTDKISAEAAGKTVSLKVTANISWTATSDQSWATVAPASESITDKKSKETSTTITVAENTGTDARTATITFKAEGVSDVKISIEQAGVALPDPVFSVLDGDLNPLAAEIPTGSSEGSVSAIVYSNISWTAASDADWLTVTPESAEVKDYVETPSAVTIAWEANKSEDAREATVTFSAEGVDNVTITVSQEGEIPFTAEVDLMSVSEYAGGPLSMYPDWSCLVSYIGMPTAPVVAGGYGLWKKSAWEDVLVDWDANIEIAIGIVDEYGNAFEDEVLEQINELEDEDKMAYWVFYDLDPETEYILVAKFVDADGRVYVDYAIHATDVAPEPANWEFYGTGKYKEGYLSGLFSIEAKEINVDIYKDPEDAHHFAMLNPYGPKMLVNWMFNDSVTEEMIEEAKGQLWDDCYYEFTINDDNTVDMPLQWLGFTHSNYGDIEAGIDPEYDPQGLYAEGVVTLQTRGATIYLPDYTGDSHYFYGNTNGDFKITMPSANSSKAASKSFVLTDVKKCKISKDITREVGTDKFKSFYCKPIYSDFCKEDKSEIAL